MAPRTAPASQDVAPRRSRRIASMTSTTGVVSGSIERNRPPARPRPRNQNRGVSPSAQDRYLEPPASDGVLDDARTPPVPPMEANWTDDFDNKDFNHEFSQGSSYDFSQSAGDTQPLSQALDRADSQPDINTEATMGVWGYLVPYYRSHGGSRIVLCRNMPPPTEEQMECGFTNRPASKVSPGCFIIGRRRPEVDLHIKDDQMSISNRHCMFYTDNDDHGHVYIKDLSSNGTFVNEQLVGRNNIRQLKDGDQIDLCRKACFTFQYPRTVDRHLRFSHKYILDQLLGRGQYGRVYSCVERSTGSRYAVKIIDQHANSSSQITAQQGEISTMMALKHANIVDLKATFHERDGFYIVMEHIRGGELFDFILCKTKLHESDTRKLFIQLFSAIQYLHNNDIAHRDLKPENILLVGDTLDQVKVADFGLAKIIGDDSFTNTLCGTPAYVAPEVYVHDAQREYNKAVDIWSLGVILYVCLCGYPPFSDELYSENYPYRLIDQIQGGMYEYAYEYWRDVSDEALDLIDNMLRVDPNRRYTIDQCRNHPWMNRVLNPNDSTLGLVDGISRMGVRRTGTRQRTLLADSFSRAVVPARSSQQPQQQRQRRETRPADYRNPRDFVQVGGYGDPQLFDDADSATEDVRDIGRPNGRERERELGHQGRREREDARDKQQRDIDTTRANRKERRDRDENRRERDDGRRERDRRRNGEGERARERERDRSRDGDGRRERANRQRQ